MAHVLVSLVTYNSASTLESCLSALKAQTFTDFEVHAVDNASGDSSPKILRTALGADKVTCNDVNVGYSAAHNRAMASSPSEYVLCLNPDVALAPDFIEEMVLRASSDGALGSFTGCLYMVDTLPAQGWDNSAATRYDSTGLVARRDFVHVDRHQGRPVAEIDASGPGQVFGASGCGAFYRRQALVDVAVEGEVLDEDFFAYAEDTDLSWRLQLRGWGCGYVPTARALHVRRLRGTGGRRTRPALVNHHLTKNRVLQRLKDFPLPVIFRNLPWALWRDAGILVYVLLFDRASLPAYAAALRLAPRMLRKRRAIMSRRTAGVHDLLRWFK